MLDIPEAVRAKAMTAGVGDWLDALPGLIHELETDWSMTVGAPYDEGTEAYVAAAELGDGTPAVLKLVVPRDDHSTRNEVTVLQLADGRGCAKLLRHDLDRDALLMERLGPSMHRLGLPLAERQRLLTDAASQLWRPAPGSGLPTGADKAQWLIDHILKSWDELDRPCSERAVEHAVACAERRLAAHDDERAVLVHGDVHEWNALRADRGFKLVDPDGLVAEPEYDLGVLMREDPLELLEGDPRERAERLAGWCGLDAEAVWEWGVVERVSTGLVATRIGLQPIGSQMLSAADQLASDA